MVFVKFAGITFYWCIYKIFITFCGNGTDVYTLFIRHVSQIRENYKTGEKTSETIHYRCDNTISGNISSNQNNYPQRIKYNFFFEIKFDWFDIFHLTYSNYCGMYYNLRMTNVHQNQHLPNKKFAQQHRPIPKF